MPVTGLRVPCSAQVVANLDVEALADMLLGFLLNAIAGGFVGHNSCHADSKCVQRTKTEHNFVNGQFGSKAPRKFAMFGRGGGEAGRGGTRRYALGAPLRCQGESTNKTVKARSWPSLEQFSGKRL